MIPIHFYRRLLPFIQQCKNALVQEKKDLNQVVTDAGKLVGYPTSSSNLRRIFTDELADVAEHYRKLKEINHPLSQTAKKLFFGSDTPAWGLIVLLVSKAYGTNVEFSDSERDVTAGVLHSQRALAEVTEMIRLSTMIHKNTANLDEKQKKDSIELCFGNKIAVLSGDYLISKSFHELACLRNTFVHELMSSALRDITEAEFLGLHDDYDVPLPTKPTNMETIEIVDNFDTKPYHTSHLLGNPVAEWTIRNILGGASLLGKSCQGSLMLAKQPVEVQHSGYVLGKCIALACQAKLEQEAVLPGTSGVFSLVSAPVMLYLKDNPSMYSKIEAGRKNALDVDYEDIRTIIRNSGALQSTQHLQHRFAMEALNVLHKIPKNEAQKALENIIKTLI